MNYFALIRGKMYKGKVCLFVLYAGLLLPSNAFISCRDRNTNETHTKLVVGVDGLQVPDGFMIEKVAGSDLVSYPMFASFDNQGRLFVTESTGETISTEEMLENPPYHILLLEDFDGDGTFDESKVFADSLTYPTGATFYNGSLYVASAPDLLRFTDTNGDGISDKREVLLTGWTLNNNGAVMGGPFFGPDGWLYITDARRGFKIETKEGEVLEGKGARIWRCRPDGTELEWLSGGGFDNAIELDFMPSGETIGTMTYFTEPKNGFRDALMHWVEGGVYPKPYPVIEEDRLKLTGGLMPVMTTLPRVAHSGLSRYIGPGFGHEFQGNFFSVQFNTGRMMRHIMTPVGATFRTEDEPFMISTVLDIHPTDLEEDANGSLLVVDTGGWFIAGCPLSVVAEAKQKGGIYRISKIDAPVVDDPWGRRVDFNLLSPHKVATYMGDPRPAVRNKAIDHLVAKGKDAIEPLIKILLSSKREDTRTSAVFTLYRINTSTAINGVRKALDDESPIVRTAAARVLGMAEDNEAVDKLMELVQEDKAPVRRQAATALGQIGDDQAISALVNASANPEDRFVEHAIIYSLITLGNPEPLIVALENPSINIRKASLIALDQMNDSPLRKNYLKPFLASADAQLQEVGIWVASHHPEWTDIVVDFLAKRLGTAELSETERVAVLNLMLNFCHDPKLQNFISFQLKDVNTLITRKLVLLDVINGCSIEELPDILVASLGNLLEGDNLKIRSQVLDLAKSRNILALGNKLKTMIDNPKTQAILRFKALSARIMAVPQLSVREFQMLLDYIGSSNESTIRLSAVQLLAQADLNENQLLMLAREQVAQLDIFLLPDLVNSFEGSTSEEVGITLMTALQSSPNRIGNLSVQDFQNLLETFPISVHISAEPILKTLHERHANRLTQLEKLEAELKNGDVVEGRNLFFGKAICSSCHAVEGKGGDFGPDLTNIGEIRSQHDILEAIVYPSTSFAREYETSKVLTKAKIYTGIVKEQLTETIIVETAPETEVRISRTEITGIEPYNISLMPMGLNNIISTQEMANLMAYLSSLPDGLGQIR